MWLQCSRALSGSRRHIAGPGFGLIGKCLSHGGFHGAAKIAAEGRPSPLSIEPMPRTSLGPWQAFLSGANNSASACWGRIRLAGIDGVCGAIAFVTIGLCCEEDRVISRSLTRQAMLDAASHIALLHMLAAFNGRRWRAGGDFCEVQRSEITNLACTPASCFMLRRWLRILVHSTALYHAFCRPLFCFLLVGCVFP